jgi:primosomal protein N' (replication factor Y)
MRVAVPVKNKMYTSIVVSLHQTPPTLYEAREIHEILDDKPIVNSFQIEHWKWVASYYMCTLGEVYRTAMPSAFILESETIISQKKDIVVDEKSLTDDEFLIFEALQHQSSLKVQDVMAILNKKNVFPIIQKLLAKNVLSLQDELQEEYKPKLLRYIRLHEPFSSDESLMNLLDSLKGAKQKETILAYFQLKAQEQKPISVKQVLAQAQVSTAVIKALIDKDIFEEYYIQEDRVTFHKNKKAIELMLSETQQKAYDEIETLFKTKDVTLLHGVTASGKTEIYIKLIESCF